MILWLENVSVHHYMYVSLKQTFENADSFAVSKLVHCIYSAVSRFKIRVIKIRGFPGQNQEISRILSSKLPTRFSFKNDEDNDSYLGNENETLFFPQLRKPHMLYSLVSTIDLTCVSKGCKCYSSVCTSPSASQKV